jgi:hypothetical protein
MFLISSARAASVTGVQPPSPIQIYARKLNTLNACIALPRAAMSHHPINPSSPSLPPSPIQIYARKLGLLVMLTTAIATW